MTHPVRCVKKLIEVALPLDKINEASSREKSIRHGHPSTLHLWWARRPLATARAVIFSQLVNDPSGRWELEHAGQIPPNYLKASWAAKRKQLFGIIEELVKWESTTNEEVLERARVEIRRSWRESCDLNKDHPQAAELFNPDNLPGLHDPFAGGGAIPLEAQRLGLEAYASDLNPVAVLINKAMIEIPPKFAGKHPVGKLPEGETALGVQDKWPGATGLAEDVRRYGAWMRSEAQKRIGHLYPTVIVTKEMASSRPDLTNMVGDELTVIAWIWARTVRSTNPAFSHVEVPLASTFILSSKAGKESYVEPVVNGETYRFVVKTGAPPDVALDGTKAHGRGSNFRCLVSGAVIGGDYIKSEGKAKRIGQRMMAVVAEGTKGRVYLDPTEVMERLALSVESSWIPSGDVPARLTGGTCVPYGLSTWDKLFTARQLVALTMFSDLVLEAIERVRVDTIEAGCLVGNSGLDDEGTGALAYAQAVGVYLAMAVSKVANIGSSIATWMNDRGAFRETFARQAIPMTWDFVEANPFANAGGSLETAFEKIFMAITTLPAKLSAHVSQWDAQTQTISNNKAISTDPPYYDNIAYADLSDFFYVWLRKSLKGVFPTLFSTVAVPKSEELVATKYRHGTRAKAEAFFLDGMTAAMHSLAIQAHPEMPVAIYYAFKQSETETDEGTASTGWETFLEAVLRAGFTLTGTWPMRTEGSGRLIAKGTNALASSIILVCRRRSDDATSASRREFLRELNLVLPEALERMVHGTADGTSPIAPVDLSQAVIGPGMEVFSKYSAVLEADGSKMSVKTALRLINRYFAANDFDNDTQWCLKWFEQNGWKQGAFGQADDLSRAMGTSVAGVAEAGVIESGGGFVRLLRPVEYPRDWNPRTDTRNPIWETLHHLIRSLRVDGETATGRLLGAVKGQIEGVRLLAFRLYTLCERAGWSEDARTYNELMTSWTAVETAAGQVREPDKQGELF
jgi:putative DNA methylase